MDFLWIGIGGFAGVNARYFLGRWINNRYGVSFPYGTFVINVSGAFLIGLILTLLTDRFIVDPRWRMMIVVGFLGGYTTFSTFAFEAMSLAEHGDWVRAAAAILGTNLFGLMACLLGMMLARALSSG